MKLADIQVSEAWAHNGRGGASPLGGINRAPVAEIANATDLKLENPGASPGGGIRSKE